MQNRRKRKTLLLSNFKVCTQSEENFKKFMKIALPPLTNPFVAIAEVDSPVIVVTTVAIPITKTDRPLGKRGGKHCKPSSIKEYKPST